MKKTIFVLWSGGADSTCLIRRLLDDDAYEVVLAGYVRLHNRDKADAELSAIARLLPLLGGGGKLVWQGVILDAAFARTNPNLAFKQIPIWLLALLEAVHAPTDEVALGYIRGRPGEEDAASHIPDLVRIWESYQPLMHRPLPKLVFPIAHLSKREVLAELPDDVRAACVFCEAPVRAGDGFAPCGRCRLCLHRPSELAE